MEEITKLHGDLAEIQIKNKFALKKGSTAKKFLLIMFFLLISEIIIVYGKKEFKEKIVPHTLV